MSGYEFSALRPGEKSRKCSKCGADFTPASRTQKKCPECGKKKLSARDTSERDRRKALKKGVERKVDNNILGLNDALFRELERIEDCGDDREAIEAEGIRADKVCNLASNIIQNGKLMLSAAAMSVGVAESVNVPKMLLGNGDGK